MKKVVTNFMKYFSVIIIFLVGFFIAPFIFNNFSFSYFNNLVFWGGISPLIFIAPTILLALFQNDD